MKLLSALALLALCVAAAALPVAHAESWVVIVSGSSEYYNYRHQADACHAYQIVRRNGIPEERVILFLYDDVANHKQNPFPGQLFNKPTEAGTPGVDVYEGIPGHIDYRGKAVTPKNFLNVLKGNSSGVPEGAKVLQSTEEDTVFIYFADHGAVGLIAFPNDYLLATELIPALEYMHEHKMYSQLVFYLEACESGSMFDKILNPNLNIYGLTAANEKESSWGTYCQPDDKVDGKTMNSCLGDLFSVSWMENSDEEGPKETLKAQHTFVKAATNLSHVMQYGDLTFLGKATGEFIGGLSSSQQRLRLIDSADFDAEAAALEASRAAKRESSAISSRDIPLHSAYYRYLRAPTFSDASTEALAELRRQLDAREQAEQRFQKLSVLLSTSGTTGKLLASPSDLLTRAPSAAMVHAGGDCVKAMLQSLRRFGCAYDDYSLQFHRLLVNYCALHPQPQQLLAATSFGTKQIEQVCTPTMGEQKAKATTILME